MTTKKLHFRSIRSVVIILLFYFGVLLISGLIPNPDLSNRVLHTFGGGFLIVVVAFLAIKDSRIRITSFQFLVISVAIAAVFGVANEIVEFFLQNQFGFVFANSINDTWLDLVSSRYS